FLTHFWPITPFLFHYLIDIGGKVWKKQNFCKKVGIFGDEWVNMVNNVQMA
ncbi:hypothetical protein HMPREF1584_00714, partial [Gardnerella vaginalis JCP8481A]